MGNTQFVPRVMNSNFVAIDFLRSDEMRIIYCVKEVESVLHKVLYRKSPGGVQHVNRPSEFVAIYTFRGRHFAGASSTGSLIEMNQFICFVLEELLLHGWLMRAGTNFIRTSKRTTFIFERVSNTRAVPSTSSNSVMSLSLSSINKLVIVNDRSGIHQVVNALIKKNWYKGLSHCQRICGDNFKFKCNGNLWAIKEVKETLSDSRLLVLNLISQLHDLGLAFYGTSHPCLAYRSVDSIFFTQHVKLDSLGKTFMLGLWRSNKIYLVDHSPEVEIIVRRCILSVWEPGIEMEEKLPRSTRIFKLAMKPWTASKLLGLCARFLVLRLLDELCSTGWRLHCTLDLCHTAADVSSFVLREAEPEACSFMAIGLHRGDRIRLINAPSDTVRHLKESMSELWPEGVMGRDEFMGCPELVLPSEIHNCVGLFCVIFDRLKILGWKLVSSADLSAQYSSDDSSEYPSDLHTLIFEREAGSYEEEALGACGGTNG